MTTRYVLLLLASALLIGAARPADAAECAWIGGAGLWATASGWSCGAVPGSADAVTITSGTVTLDADATVGALTLGGGTLSGSGFLTVTGPLVWSAGTMAGPGTTRVYGGTTFAEATSKRIGRRLELASNTTWSDGTLVMLDGGLLFNGAGRTFSDAAAGTHSIALDGSATTVPDVLNRGTWLVASAGTNMNVHFVNEGVLVVGGHGLDVNAPGGLTNTGVGVLRGAALLDVSSGAAFVNEGSTHPGPATLGPAHLPVRGPFPMGPDHTLHVELDGAAAAGTDYDQLVIEDGDVGVDGRLFIYVNYAAEVGQAYDVVAHAGSGTVSGCYDPDDIVVIPDEYLISVVCTESSVSLEVVGTTAGEPGAAPEALRLTAAYPNPFATRTALELTVPSAQHVAVEAFDGLGRRVATLFEGTLAGGTPHELALEAGALPAGIYLVRATGDGFALTRRVTLAR